MAERRRERKRDRSLRAMLRNIPHRAGEVMNPLYTAADFAGAAAGAPIYHPIFVNGPIVSQLDFPPLPGMVLLPARLLSRESDPGPAPASAEVRLAWMARLIAGIITPASSVPFDLDPVDWRLGPSQSIPCKTSGACAGQLPRELHRSRGGLEARRDQGRAGHRGRGSLHRSRREQLLQRHQRRHAEPGSRSSSPRPRTSDASRPSRAVVRYSNCRTTPASAAHRRQWPLWPGQAPRIGNLAVDDPGWRHRLREWREFHLAPGLSGLRLRGLLGSDLR